MSKRKASGMMTKKQQATVIEIVTLIEEELFMDVSPAIQREVVVRIAAITCVMTAEHEGITGMMEAADNLHNAVRGAIAAAVNNSSVLLPDTNETRQ